MWAVSSLISKIHFHMDSLSRVGVAGTLVQGLYTSPATPSAWCLRGSASPLADVTSGVPQGVYPGTTAVFPGN